MILFKNCNWFCLLLNYLTYKYLMILSEEAKRVKRLSEFYNDRLPDSYPVGIHKAVLEGNLYMVAQLIVSGEDVNSRDSFYHCTVLHLAVITQNIALLKYFLEMDDIELDVKCLEGRTPLYVAAALGYLEFAQKLIENGADVNVSDRNGNPLLHVAIFHPDVCHLLIRHGARMDTATRWGATLLHNAVVCECVEVVHMLLYYNVDTNVTDMEGCTPFMTALMRYYVDAQEALLEYVDDFNRSSYAFLFFGSTLSFALSGNSPFVKDIIERGARVNYGDDSKLMAENCAFFACLQCPVDLSTFKMVWERLRYNDAKNTIDLLDLFKFPKVLPTFLSAIIESDNFDVAVQFFSKGDNYISFVNKFAEGKFDFDQLTVLTCRLLEHHFRASSHDIHAIFSQYGYCELFRILLYMDNDFSRGWLPHMTLTRLIFDIDYDLKNVVDKVSDIPKEAVLQLLRYSICPCLIDALSLQYSDDKSMRAILDKLSRVPSLIELARNVVRKQIWESFKITNTCQFYTTVDYLDIPTVFKDIITFKRKIYRIT